MPIYNLFFLDQNQRVQPVAMATKGPRLAGEISVPQKLAEHLSQTGKPIPQPHTGDVLIDTGASRTSVDRSIVAALGLAPVGAAKVLTPSGQAPQMLYPARFSFPGTPLPSIEFSSVLGSDLQQQGIAALLGRDVLSSFLLVYNGPGGYISIGW